MGNLKQMDFLEVAKHFENEELNGSSNKTIYMVRTSHYVNWIKEDVLKHIIEKNNIENGIYSFLDEHDFQRQIDIVEVTCVRDELVADSTPITVSDILNSLYFSTDKTE